MQKISLNFYGEELTIHMPKDLSSLRKEISEKFLFEPADVQEMILSYQKGSKIKLINSDHDFKTFARSKIPKIILSIKQNSRIYQEKKIEIEQEQIKLKAGKTQLGTTAEYAAEFYVSPEGDDSGDGSSSKPFKTLAKARDAVREKNTSMSGDICVYLKGGIYRFTEPVVFDTRDSGTGGHRIIYKAFEDEKPIFNGAKQVTGWTKHDDKLFKATLDRDIKLRNLFVNDKRANMTSIRVQAKGGVGEYNVKAGQAAWAWDNGKKSDGISYNINDIPKIPSNFDDLEIINGTTWNENIVCTRDVKNENGNLVMYLQQPYGAIAQTPGWNAGFNVGGQHTIYNSFSFFKEPGQFYFDKKEKVLYYYPRQGEDMTSADVEAPVAEKLIVIEGKSNTDRVKNIDFQGIIFENTDFQLTEVGGSHGKTTVQAANSYIAFADGNWHNKKYEMADTLPGMIEVRNSESITFKGNTVKHSGADGISMSNDVINSEISGNYITDITSSGITMGHPQHIYIGDQSGQNHEKFPPNIEGLCKNNVITNNMLYDISVVHGFGGCAAITAFYVEKVSINNNQINKTAYNGIHLGWGWCNFKDSTTCKDNSICYNRITNSVNRLHDSGAIYTIGQMPGTIINQNYVEGIPAAGNFQPTYGLHNDEGTCYIEENDNVLEIDPNVTYTINCEEWGDKHNLTIKRTYATVNKMGKNPPSSDIDQPIVVRDNVWPLAQYKICVASGVKDEFSGLVPTYLVSDADRVFPAACQAPRATEIPVRSSRSSDNAIWFAPNNTTSFKAGDDMTTAEGTAVTIKTPNKEGEYFLYVVGKDGAVKSKSKKLLRVKGNPARLAALVQEIDDEDVLTQLNTMNEKKIAVIRNTQRKLEELKELKKQEEEINKSISNLEKKLNMQKEDKEIKLKSKKKKLAKKETKEDQFAKMLNMAYTMFDQFMNTIKKAEDEKKEDE